MCAHTYTHVCAQIHHTSIGMTTHMHTSYTHIRAHSPLHWPHGCRAQPLLLLCAPNTRSRGRPPPPRDSSGRQEPRAGGRRGGPTVLSVQGCCVSFHRCSKEKTISCWWPSGWQQSSLPDGRPLPAQIPLRVAEGHRPVATEGAPVLGTVPAMRTSNSLGHCEDGARGLRERAQGD